MDFNIDFTSLLSGIIVSGLVYLFGGIFKLKHDMTHAFTKIRQLEKRNEDASSIRENLSEDAGKNAN